MDRRDKISRRGVLKGALGTALAFPSGQAGAQQSRIWIVRIDLEGARSVAGMLETLRAFTERRVPLLVVLAPDLDAEQVRAISDLVSVNGGLIECAAVLTRSPGDRRYFQTRAASELRRSLSEKGWSSILPLRCCDLQNAGAFTDPFAFRDAGFRVLMSETGSDPELVLREGGLLEIRGSLPTPANGEPTAVLASARQPVGIFRFSLNDLLATGRQEIWASAFSEAFWNGSALVTLPSDHLLQQGRGITCRLAVVLEAASTDAPDGPSREIMEQFAARNWSLSTVSPDSEEGFLDCEPSEVTEGSPPTLFCKRSYPAGLSGYDERIVLLRPEQNGSWTGQRSDGTFQVASARWPSDGLADALREDPFSDRVLVLGRSDIETSIQRRRVLSDLESYARLNQTGVVSVERLVADLLAPQPALDRLWSHRSRMSLDPPRPRLLDPDARNTLLEDALIAWNFIRHYSDARTGFCFGTVDLNRGGSTDKSITMWDVASQIMGTIGAGSLGLINRAEVNERIELILAHLPVTTLGGHRLPPSFFHASSLNPLEAAFDSCDTGRFLNALMVAVEAGAVTRESAAKFIAHWDLSAAVRGGHIHNYEKGRFIDVTQSHCNAYVARGYSRWGFEVARALPALPANPSADDLMALIFAAGDIGAYGTEPMLLDLLETGADPAIRYLAELLFDAQLSWYEETGELKCVSESPLNFAPWFIYSGLRVDRAGDAAWTLQTLTNERAFQTEAFRRKAEVLSTKSAYLWEAIFPHPYSTQLRELMQAKARIDDAGFSAGLFAEDLAPMANYSDLNTNGIILSAIARLLG